MRCNIEMIRHEKGGNIEAAHADQPQMLQAQARCSLGHLREGTRWTHPAVSGGFAVVMYVAETIFLFCVGLRSGSQGVFPGDVDATSCSFRIHSRFNEPYIHLEIVKLTAAGKWK